MDKEPFDDLELDLFQEALLEACLAGASASGIKTLLLEDSRLEKYREYIESWDPRMAELARELTKKWAREG